uniref:Uncharacterized protein n=1 Tax=Rhizophora mucronata TaxID=61149 RepID=A0A2P2MY42_RHIMU
MNTKSVALKAYLGRCFCVFQVLYFPFHCIYLSPNNFLQE